MSASSQEDFGGCYSRWSDEDFAALPWQALDAWEGKPDWLVRGLIAEALKERRLRRSMGRWPATQAKSL